jgi:L-asparagine permease
MKEPRESLLEAQESGYRKTLGNRQIQMIAIGGAIGTGLFLGAGARLRVAGPSLALVYLVCGGVAFLVLRALGELAMHRPSSGSFVSYAREFLGEKYCFVAGWMFFFSWVTTGIVDITAVAIYVHYWDIFAGLPQWVSAFVALLVVGSMNLIGVAWFAELEFWFALIKVVAIGLFLCVGTVYLGGGFSVAGVAPGIHLVSENGGVFPHGVLPMLLLIQGVIFAFSGVELIGTAAGECVDPGKVLPKAINSVIWRIAFFYVGTIALLVCLLPWTAYKADESPFVTFFAALGVPGIGSIMNMVVLTAALSSLNSGLYSTGRVLRALAEGGSAPPALARMSKNGVPYVGILLTIFIFMIGVVLNYLVPSQVFELVINASALCIFSNWGFILVCQIAFRRKVAMGEEKDVAFKMPFAPFTSWFALIFLFSVLVMMAFDYPNGTLTVVAFPVVASFLAIGWSQTKHLRSRS